MRMLFIFITLLIVDSFSQPATTLVQVTYPVVSTASNYRSGVTYALRDDGITVVWKSFNKLNLFNINLINRESNDTVSIARNYNDTFYVLKFLNYFTDYIVQIQPFDTAYMGQPAKWGNWTSVNFKTASFQVLFTPALLLPKPTRLGKYCDTTTFFIHRRVWQATRYSNIIEYNDQQTKCYYGGGGSSGGLIDTFFDIKSLPFNKSKITSFYIIITARCDTLYDSTKAEDNQDTLTGESLQISYLYYPPTKIQLNHIAPSTNTKPFFKWQNIDTSYFIQISQSKLFDTAIYSGYIHDSTFVPSINMPTGKIYWHVAAESLKRNLGNYMFSDVDSFIIYPTVSLNHISSSTNCRPILSWSKTTPSYTIQIDTVKTFISPVKNVVTADTFLVTTNDLPTKTIYWRVRDVNGYSAIDSFTIFATLTLNHISSSLNKLPVFSWTKTDISYTLQFDTTKSFQNSITTTDTFFIPTTDLPFKTIYWRVSDTRGYSNIDSFTVYKTIVLNHISSSINKKPVFSWIKTYAPYTLQIDSTTISVNDTFYIPANDLPTKTIYWRVKDIHGIFTNMDSFTVYKTILLNRIASSNNKKPIFSWTKTDTAYTLQIDTSRVFTTLIRNVIVKDTFYTSTTDLPIKTIYWRVFDSHGMSAIDSFKVLSSVSVLGNENNYSSYKIVTNKNSIAIFLHNYQASLTVYNVKGQILKHIISKNNIIFKCETSGVYVSIIKVNNQTFKRLNIIQ